MLDTLRKGTGTWIAKIFIALLVFSFAIWGVADVFSGFGQNVAAKVGDTEVSTFTFDRAYRQELNRFGQQFGRPLTNAEGAQLGLPQQVLGTLIGQAALNETARQMNLGVSDERLAGDIQSDPAFVGPTGTYDRTRLAQILRSNGMTEDEYVIERRDGLNREQLAAGVAGGMQAPLAYLEALHVFQNESRDIRYIRLEPDVLGDIEQPDAAALEAFYEEAKREFRAPEYRKIALLTVTAETLANPDAITDEDARADYERDLARFSQPERRRVQQMVFQDPAEATAAAEALESGTPFEELMAERNLTDSDVDLGLMSRADFLDDAVGDAAFSVQTGQTSEPVDGRFSTVILNVTEVIPARTQPFDEIKDQIKAELAEREAQREILDLFDEIEDARAGGALLSEIAERFGLTVTEPEPFDRSGLTMDGDQARLPDANGLIPGTFDAEVGMETDPIQLQSGGFVWYEVNDVIPARDRDLEEVRPDVVAAWRAAEIARRLQEKAEALVTRVQNGETLDAVSGTEGLEISEAWGVTRTAGFGGFAADAVDALFAGPQGTAAAVAASQAPARIVAVVSSVMIPPFNPDADEIQALLPEMSRRLQDSILGQYVADIETREGVEINNASITRVLGLNSTQ
ncbi:peptidylprolyl isomerase [Roseibium aquae]|uniref:Parvulin-like PPIase n=1 Tax=Roseibium aquae TaxID=1323746 RepID=A0A916X2I2_9HYPH|nr:peptidylprolyl isomerase [Roseibium aquae]GGB61977.1 peptidylprolyl isomerase [Roseibium aquae]